MKDQIEKQAIEKMAKDLADTWVVDFEGNPHDLSEVLMFSDIFNIAEQLCERGYRRQSKGEWKQIYEKAPRYVCTNCNHLCNNKGYKFCPNCGAKMKGGAE